MAAVITITRKSSSLVSFDRVLILIPRTLMLRMGAESQMRQGQNCNIASKISTFDLKRSSVRIQPSLTIFSPSRGNAECNTASLVWFHRVKKHPYPETGKRCPFFEELHAVVFMNVQESIKFLRPNLEPPNQRRNRRGYVGMNFLKMMMRMTKDGDVRQLEKTRKRKTDRAQRRQRPMGRSGATISSNCDLLRDFLQQRQRMAGEDGTMG
ncbi:hypothetical protein COCNU_07G015610 [Cocos nucifera]|uniref:Uncharacterized protein n=1 Tax=Cocos nucifera TaxID=13894 RepID=A0A8K0IGZ5_COCNU|nr:hypothetical protein COCNU_07G015610 [Cocos nucifera]